MALWDALTRRNGHPATPAPETRLREQRLYAAEANVELLQEELADLRTELALDDLGWSPLGATDAWQLGYAQLRSIRHRARAMYLRNPLINRAVSLQAMYVFGQGVSFTAADARVQTVVDAFLEDPANQTELTSHQARILKETELQVDGNLYFVLFTDRAGAVRVRTIRADEVTDILTNPEDAKEPWYYKREWTQQTVDPATGQTQPKVQRAYYPDWRYAPPQRPVAFGPIRVEWDTPVYHVKVGGFSDMKFGVPETYAAHDWALAHKKNLEDWASIVEAHRKFAFQVKTPGGGKAVAALKAKLGTTFASGTGTPETNPPPGTASTAIMTGGYDLTPVRTAGATVSADDSRQLKLMVAAALGLPEIFFGDADVGNHATAKVLDRPTELKVKDRQTLWADVFVDILTYAVDQRLDATGGNLGPAPVLPAGSDVLTPDQPDQPAELDKTVDVGFPPILQHDLSALVSAVVETITLAGHPPYSDALLRELLPYILNALGEDDVDAKLAALFPEQEPAAPTDALPAPEDQVPRDPADAVVAQEAARAARVRITDADLAATARWAQDVLSADAAARVRGDGA